MLAGRAAGFDVPLVEHFAVFQSGAGGRESCVALEHGDGAQPAIHSLAWRRRDPDDVALTVPRSRPVQPGDCDECGARPPLVAKLREPDVRRTVNRTDVAPDLETGRSRPEIFAGTGRQADP